MNSEASKDDIDPGLVIRLRQCAEMTGSGDELSRRTGIPRRSLENYLSGKSTPKLKPLIAIAKIAGVRLEWLATGDGIMRPGDATEPQVTERISTTDHRLIGRLTEKIMLIYKEMGIGLALHQAAERAAQEHDRIVAEVADPDDRLIQIGVVMTALREELRAKASTPSTSKHRA